MRIIGVDCYPHPPEGAPTPGRAQAWSVCGPANPSVIHLRFVDDDVHLVEHELTVQPMGVTALNGNRSIIAVLASHPNDIQSAIASYRVLGWTSIGTTVPEEYHEHGYAICVFVSNT